MIKLFHTPRTRSLRVLWMAEEMGIPCEIEPVEFAGPKTDAFKAANPSGTLPAIVDGPVTMTESVAILQYMADRYGPTDLSVKAEEPGYPDYLQFLVLGEGGLGAPLNGVIGTLFRGPEAERSNWTVGMIKEGFVRRSRLVANQLAKHEFLAADRFTAADISVAYALGIGIGLLEMGDQLGPALVDYYKRMTARPAYLRAAAK
ncbi:MAG TPA: glutathione S-transferase family protein [Caulobacteraceae bacterium]|jgi:glutathione S-transferase|nr:glutathione S-transferase family protein [Caulobacteraceae bacterium]